MGKLYLEKAFLNMIGKSVNRKDVLMFELFWIIAGLVFLVYAILKWFLPFLSRMSREGAEVKEFGRALTDEERQQLGKKGPETDYEFGLFRDRTNERRDLQRLRDETEAAGQKATEKKIREAIDESINGRIKREREEGDTTQ